jgi:hypothetical protein
MIEELAHLEQVQRGRVQLLLVQHRVRRVVQQARVHPVPVELEYPCTAPSDGDGIGIATAVVASTLPEGGIVIGVCGRAPGPIAGEGIAICTCPEGLGAKPTPASSGRAGASSTPGASGGC